MYILIIRTETACNETEAVTCATLAEAQGMAVNENEGPLEWEDTSKIARFNHKDRYYAVGTEIVPYDYTIVEV